MNRQLTTASAQTDAAYLNQLREKGSWATAQVSLVRDKSHYECIIRSFLATSYISSMEEQSHAALTHKNELVVVGWHYAQLTKQTLEIQATHKQFSSFQFLVWLSYLAFLQSTGESAETIDEILQIHYGQDEKRRKRLIPRALKINSVMQEIARKCEIGVSRATELFFLCELKDQVHRTSTLTFDQTQ
jgi:hypothetical protein